MKYTLFCNILCVEQGGRKRRYADSIESLVRNNIQKMKIDMANEVIDAGRFDMQTSMEERKQTLEAMLQVSPYSGFRRLSTQAVSCDAILRLSRKA